MKFQRYSEATKGMDFKTKMDYTWTYYKLPIIAVVCLLFVGTYTFYEFQNRRDAYLNIILTVGNRGQQSLDALVDELNVTLIPEEQQGGYTVVVRPLSFSMAEGAPVSPEESQAVMLMLAVGDMDIAVLDQETFEHLASLDSLAPLDSFGVALNPDDTVYFDGQPFGVRSEVFADLVPVLPEGDFVVVSGLGASRPEAIAKFLAHNLES